MEGQCAKLIDLLIAGSGIKIRNGQPRKSLGLRHFAKHSVDLLGRHDKTKIHAVIFAVGTVALRRLLDSLHLSGAKLVVIKIGYHRHDHAVYLVWADVGKGQIAPPF